MSRKSNLRRAGIGCGASLLVVALIVGIFVVWQWNDLSARAANLQVLLSELEYSNGLETEADILSFIEQQGADAALVAYSVRPDGTPEESGAIYHNADTPMPLASTMKIVLLAAYAQEVAAGELDPNEQVAVGEWERFYLPGTDGGAHAAALDELQIAQGPQGFADDPTVGVTLDQVARAMIRWSDNAATDYLLERLGEPAVQAVFAEAGMQNHDPILPLLGTYLSWRNHEQPDQDDTKLDALLALDAEAYAAEVHRLTAAYQDPQWRAAELRWRADGPPTSRLEYEVRAAHALMPQGTANDYARIMSGVVSDILFTSEVNAVMRRYLEWPMEFEGNQERFLAFGTKGGSVASVLTEASYVIPATGDFADQPRVVALFMREMPPAAWLRLQQTFAHQKFMVEWATQHTYAEEVNRQLASTEEVQ